MSDGKTPFYERGLDSFADHIICHVRQNKDGHWRASLDCGLTSGPGDPDFASYGYGATAEEAAGRCADVIRADARGIGKFAPHAILTPGHDLNWKLMRHWDKKERLEALGRDPNLIVSKALTATERDEWQMRSENLIAKWSSTRIMEFEFQLLMAEAINDIRENGADLEEMRERVVEGLKHVMKDNVRVHASSDETWVLVDARMDEMFGECNDVHLARF